MGIIKYILKRIKCKCRSSCDYNNNPFDISHLHRSLNHYTLKNKDIEKILKILNKRKLKNISIII